MSSDQEQRQPEIQVKAYRVSGGLDAYYAVVKFTDGRYYVTDAHSTEDGARAEADNVIWATEVEAQ
jgi:hypothetical protein